MKRKMILGLLLLGVFAFLALNVRVGHAAPRNGYEISWYTVDGGGAQNLTGGTYTLSGTAGQADAGALSGGTYTLAGGFCGGELLQYLLSLPFISR